jgi:hypothetical protein
MANLVDLVIDGGYGDNVGSTIIDLSGAEPEIIREGKGDIDIIYFTRNVVKYHLSTSLVNGIWLTNNPP